MQRSDHFDGRRFFNPSGAAGQPFTALPRLLLEQRTAWPAHVAVPPQPVPPVDPASIVVTFIGHSTFLIQTPAGNILTDPMFSERAGPLNLFGPRRVRPPAVRLDDLPPIAFVLLSHNHYDHCDLPTLRRLAARFDPFVVTPLGNAALVRSTGITKVEELDWWEESRVSPLPVTVTPAQHFSARTPFDRNRALWGGFVFIAAGRRIYFAGDSAYTQAFAGIHHRLGAVDLALLPIGAYEPRWFMQAVHMNPAEAVQAHIDLGEPLSIGMHFGTFQLTTEGIDEPVQALAAARAERGIAAARFDTLPFGGSLRLPLTEGGLDPDVETASGDASEQSGVGSGGHVE